MTGILIGFTAFCSSWPVVAKMKHRRLSNRPYCVWSVTRKFSPPKTYFGAGSKPWPAVPRATLAGSDNVTQLYYSVFLLGTAARTRGTMLGRGQCVAYPHGGNDGHASFEERRLIEGKYLLGETVRELSAPTGLTEKAVEARLGRLRQHLDSVYSKTPFCMNSRETESHFERSPGDRHDGPPAKRFAGARINLMRRRRQAQTIVRACAVVCLLLVPIAILMTSNFPRAAAPAVVSGSPVQPRSPPNSSASRTRNSWPCFRARQLPSSALPVTNA